MFISPWDLIGDERGTTTLEWITVATLIILIAAAAVKRVVVKGEMEGMDIERGINNAFGAMLP